MDIFVHVYNQYGDKILIEKTFCLFISFVCFKKKKKLSIFTDHLNEHKFRIALCVASSILHMTHVNHMNFLKFIYFLLFIRN